MVENKLNSNKGQTIIALFLYIVVLSSCLSIFQYYFSKFFGGVGFYFILVFPLFMMLLQNKHLRLTELHLKQIICFGLWALFQILINQFVSNYQYSNIIFGIDFNVFTLQTFEVILIFALYVILNISNQKKVKINILKIMIFSLIIDAIITLRALKVDPEISRIMATGSDSLNTHGLIGVSGYSIIYSIVIIFPLFLYTIGEKKIKIRPLVLVFIVLMMVLIYNSAYTTAIIAVLLGISIYTFLNSSKLAKVFFFPFILMLTLVFVNPQVLYNLLKYLSINIGILPVSKRLSQLANLVLFGDATGDSLIRLELYQRSLDAFLQHPLTGITIYDPNYLLSGHSVFLDILGGNGLLGFIPYVLFIWYSYRIAIWEINNRKCKNAIRTSYLVFCCIASINTLATSLTIMLFLLFFTTWYPIYFKDLLKTKQAFEGSTQ